jgi:hypothetical protein
MLCRECYILDVLQRLLCHGFFDLAALSWPSVLDALPRLLCPAYFVLAAVSWLLYLGCPAQCPGPCVLLLCPGCSARFLCPGYLLLFAGWSAFAYLSGYSILAAQSRMMCQGFSILATQSCMAAISCLPPGCSAFSSVFAFSLHFLLNAIAILFSSSSNKCLSCSCLWLPRFFCMSVYPVLGLL